MWTFRQRRHGLTTFPITRGFRVPAEVGWVHGLPVLSSGRQARATDAGVADHILDVVGDLAKAHGLRDRVQVARMPSALSRTVVPGLITLWYPVFRTRRQGFGWLVR